MSAPSPSLAEWIAARRAELDRLFGSHGLRPFHLQGAFDAQALSEHLCEGQA